MSTTTGTNGSNGANGASDAGASGGSEATGRGSNGAVYYRVRTTVIRVLRAIPGLRGLARAIVADEFGRERARARRRGSLVPMDIRAGRFFPEHGGRTLPVVVLVATGAQPGDAETLADAVERAQMMSGSFRPLFVVDGAELGPFRARGFAVEHVMPRERYADTNPHDSYTEYLQARVAAVTRAYRAASVVPLPPDGGDPHTLRLIGIRAR